MHALHLSVPARMALASWPLLTPLPSLPPCLSNPSDSLRCYMFNLNSVGKAHREADFDLSIEGGLRVLEQGGRSEHNFSQAYLLSPMMWPPKNGARLTTSIL